ncbi:MAG: hypothetical protein H6597_05550 [Flavobacteriales bacterium]|nr:hypothetical protein [Flavobacteriales bacterium]MCB9193979.1 hypothetical protein [Flavobacteriales bacterium]
MIGKRDLLVQAMVIAALCLQACGGTRPHDPVEDVMLPDTVTFAEHIAPIVRTKCMPCHRPGQIGPFPLITCSDVRRKAKTVRFMTSHRYMPPWPADTAYTRFLGEQVLSARQIALIMKWVDTGAFPGDTAHLKPPPDHPDDPPLGKPDLVVWLPDTMHVPGDARDRFMIAKAPFEIPRDTFVRDIVFVPGNRALVHHMNGGLINYAPDAKTDVFSGHRYIDATVQKGVDAFTALRLANDDGTWPALTPSAVNYLPGMLPPMYPEGIGGYHFKRKGAILLNTLHFGPAPHDTIDRSRFLVYYAAGPPKRPLKELSMGSLGVAPVDPPLHLEPGQVGTFHSQYRLPTAISVLSVNPHMHLLGRKFLAYAVTESGDTIPLVRINDWDFRWQFVYTFPHIVVLPKGATIHMYGTFDNTAESPQQPFDPPREVIGTDSPFMRTTDEMLQFFITYIDHQEGDERISLAPGVSGVVSAPAAAASR